MFHDVADDEARTVERGGGRWDLEAVAGREDARTRTEILETADSGASFGFGQVGSVAVYVEDYVASGVADDCVGMGRAIVEEMDTGLGGGLSALCLGSRERAEGDQNSGIDSSTVIQKYTNDFLEMLSVFG